MFSRVSFSFVFNFFFVFEAAIYANKDAFFKHSSTSSCDLLLKISLDVLLINCDIDTRSEDRPPVHIHNSIRAHNNEVVCRMKSNIAIHYLARPATAQ